MIEKSSGNVFKDLGLSNPEERLAKAELSVKINTIIQKRRWNQKTAAEKLGLTQPKISLLSRGRLSGFSIEKLMKLLTLLNQDIEIVVRHKPRKRGHIRVIFSA